MDYLDTKLFRNSNNGYELLTNTFFKPTDTHQLVDKKYFHRKCAFKSILTNYKLPFLPNPLKEADSDEAYDAMFQTVSKGELEIQQRWLNPNASSYSVNHGISYLVVITL